MKVADLAAKAAEEQRRKKYAGYAADLETVMANRIAHAEALTANPATAAQGVAMLSAMVKEDDPIASMLSYYKRCAMARSGTPGTEPMRLAPRTVQGRFWAEACGAAPGGRLAPKAGPREGWARRPRLTERPVINTAAPTFVIRRSVRAKTRSR